MKHKTDEDPNQEVDVWMGAYSGRTMLPSFIVCGLLTFAIASLAGYLYEEYQVFEDNPKSLRYASYGLTGIIWLVQLGRWGYRTVTCTYRLTTHRLLRDRGFICPAAGAVELKQITTVKVKRTWLERLIGVGRVYVECGEACAEIIPGERKVPASGLVLEGVYRPKRVATMIEASVKRARERVG